MERKSTLIYLKETDLTKEQIDITQRSYRENAQAYAMDYERNMNINGSAILKTLIPFLNQYERNNLRNTILFAGCGSCRDLQFCEEAGFQCIGIDTSKELLDIAKQHGVKSELVPVDILDFDFQENYYGGIYCDTALTHTSRENLNFALKKFHSSLRSKGVLFIAFRGGNGETYMTLDDYGERYYTTMTVSSALSLVISSGFNVNFHNVNKHPVPGRPDFIVIIATKL